ncbi:serine hydrolase domain-containing protein [Blastococcus sp. SYSU D01042]
MPRAAEYPTAHAAPRNRWMRRALLGASFALAGVYRWQRPLLLTGTGYAAHNACAVRHVAGRSDAAADLPPNPLVRVLRVREDGDTAEVGLLGLLTRQRAWYTPGFGATVARSRPALPRPVDVPAGANPFTSAPAPTAEPAVEAALSRAFGDDLDPADRAALGTRAVLVIRDGRLVAERYAPGFDAGTPQLGWSVTKSVINLVVGRLVQQGVVSLDDAGLRPEWAGDARCGITVRHLLSMTSGLSWDETYALGTPITRMLYMEEDMGSYVASRELAHEPGTFVQYSSGSTTLLCSVLAERSGLGANLPRTLLFGPLGLSSAVLETDGAGTPVGSSYMWATPPDWAAVGQFALDDGVWNGERLLPEGWIAESVTAVRGSGEQDGNAAGWWANLRADGTLVHPELPEDAYFAQGHDAQWIAVVPSARLVVVRLGFTPAREDDRVPRLVADLLPSR